MKVLSLDVLAESLVCPMCRGGQLRAVDSKTALQCVACTRLYKTEHGVVSFLVPEQLSKTNVGEIAANTYADEASIARILEREDWNPLLTYQMKSVIKTVIRMMPKREELFALGTGAGLDLSLLLRERPFVRVFASDISPSATALVERSLTAYAGDLGLFASEFGHCPVLKRPGALGLVFQALHHAPDSHAALAALLDHNFDELIIVEPITNPPLGLLASFDLVQRVEYSGTRPDWLSLPRVRTIASERGFAIASQTWWDVPPYFAGPNVIRHEPVWRTLFEVFGAVSYFTNLIRFGSMAAIHLTRTR